jgi:hypothetical protein
MADLDPSQLPAVIACVDLVGRSGARNFEIGYLHDNVPVDQAAWYAHAQYRGGRITAQDHTGPEQAATALAMRLLTGAKCRCGKLATLIPGEAFAFTAAHTSDGAEWNADQAAAAGQCHWRLIDATWQPSCPTPPGRNRS